MDIKQEQRSGPDRRSENATHDDWREKTACMRDHLDSRQCLSYGVGRQYQSLVGEI